MLLAEWGVGQVLWSLFWLFLFVMWFWLVITIFVDLIRSDDMGGWGKALWAIGIIIVPFFGVFLYLIIRGGSMHERAATQAKADQEAFRAYVQQSAGTSSTADELAKLASLRDAGSISSEEYETLKAKAVGS